MSTARWLGLAVPLAGAWMACAPPHASQTPIASAGAAPSASTSAPAAESTSAPSAAPTEAPAGKELPGGGRTIFPDHVLVGFCGTPGAPALGELWTKPEVKAKKLLTFGAQYAGSRKLLPVFELIAVVVQGYAGPDGKWRVRVFDKVVDEYLRVARENNGILLLNIQPGASDFLTEVKRFDKYLHEPDVGIALDPEWAMIDAKHTPGVFYGQATGDTISSVIQYMADIVKQDDLPEKVLVFHRVNAYVVKHEEDIKQAPGVVVVESVDGLGPKGMKINTYNALMHTKAPWIHPGFKLFFDEDTHNGGRLMSPKEVLELTPQPEYVMYE
ncbi:MAG TPA: hypothetical protein VF765_17825 [Polyangiaceae bacterium]